MNEQRVSWYATAAFGVFAILGVLVHFMELPALVVSIALFLGGSIAMCAALVVAAGRSRTLVIPVTGLFFMADSTPKDVQRQMLSSFGAQCVIAIATASIGTAKEALSPSAFGVLAPIAGLGLCGLWAARHGTFPPKPDDEAPAE